MLQLLKPKAKLILTPKDIKGETIDDEKYYEYLTIINEAITDSTVSWIILPRTCYPLGKLLTKLKKECRRSGWNLYLSGSFYELMPRTGKSTFASICCLLGGSLLLLSYLCGLPGGCITLSQFLAGGAAMAFLSSIIAQFAHWVNP